MTTTPQLKKGDLEAQVRVKELPAGHSGAHDILKADDGVARSKGPLAPLWSAMAWFDEVSSPLPSSVLTEVWGRHAQHRARP